jgi:hypothetical protein
LKNKWEEDPDNEKLTGQSCSRPRCLCVRLRIGRVFLLFELCSPSWHSKWGHDLKLSTRCGPSYHCALHCHCSVANWTVLEFLTYVDHDALLADDVVCGRPVACHLVGGSEAWRQLRIERPAIESWRCTWCHHPSNELLL